MGSLRDVIANWLVEIGDGPADEEVAADMLLADIRSHFAKPGAVTDEWRPIEEAKKGGETIWICLVERIPDRPDLKRWFGAQFPARHPGITENGFDIGWSVALPVGHGGFPDEWIAGWRPLPPGPLSAALQKME